MHHQRSALAATVTASIGQPSAGMNVRCPSERLEHAAGDQRRRAARSSPGSGRSRTRRRRGAAGSVACRADTTSSATRSHGDDAQQHPVNDHGVTTAAARARRSPRDRARSSGRGSPAGGRSASLIISRMCSTDAEDMLPTSARDRRLAATAPSGSFRARCTASITFGPPGWQIQLADVVDGQAVLGEETGDAVGQAALDHGGRARSSARCGSSRRSAASRARRRCRGRPRCGMR